MAAMPFIDFGVKAMGFGVKAMGFGVKAMGFGVKAMGFGVKAMGVLVATSFIGFGATICGCVFARKACNNRSIIVDNIVNSPFCRSFGT